MQRRTRAGLRRASRATWRVVKTWPGSSPPRRDERSALNLDPPAVAEVADLEHGEAMRLRGARDVAHGALVVDDQREPRARGHLLQAHLGARPVEGAAHAAQDHLLARVGRRAVAGLAGR